MVQVRVTHAEQIENLFSTTPKQARIVLWRAINRAATAGKTRASVQIRRNYYIKAEDIKRRIKIRTATVNRLSAVISASGPVTPLMKFNVTPSFPNVMLVRARVKKKGSQKPIPNAFVTRVKNGHVNVFTRVGSSRYPIRGRYGPSVPQMMGNEDVIENILGRTQEVLDSRLEHELTRLLRGEF